jgi:hypothetical protein
MDRWKGKNWAGSGIPRLLSAAVLLFCNFWVFSFSWAGPQTIVELQPFREMSSIEIKGEQGEDGLASLINLNPNINAWYLLQIKWRKSGVEESYHLENAYPRTQWLLLDKSNPTGLVIVEGEKNDPCDLWGTGTQFSPKRSAGPNEVYRLKQARASGAAYAPLCGGRLYLRIPTKGHQTAVERVTDFLRDNVPGGEKIVSFVRDTVFRYVYQIRGEEKSESKPDKGPLLKERNDTPVPALLDPMQAGRVANPTDLGIQIEDPSKSGMVLGAWYAVKDNPGIHVSLIVPNVIAPEILRSYRNVVSGLDSVEVAERVYLVAFDLDQFNLKYALGTEHPRVGWSDHILSQMKDKSLPGPDGIGTIAPLVSTGLISPRDEGSTIATFTGGFKREHGAFRYGPLALRNHGSHYGFLEKGVVLSKLQPGLATLYVLNHGWVDMKTWAEEDDRLLSKVRYARQNGVPIITDFDQVTQLSTPGPLVSRWGEGNWSGSSDKKLRTMRAGAALQESGGKRFLIYAFFWNATPSAMARVFQAYRCRYAMLLDMNALEHTYLAVYRRRGSNIFVQHLIKGMSEVDMSLKGQYIPRFLGYADDRDFFYLTRKEVP